MTKSMQQQMRVFFLNFEICFEHLVLSEMISFEKIFKTVAQMFPVLCKLVVTVA